MIQQTSLESYKQIKKELGKRQLEVLNTLKELKEANNLMIAKKLNLPINSITPRIKELRDIGIVVESYRDRCPYTKRETIFWKIKNDDE